jgi:hypothetical protein
VIGSPTGFARDIYRRARTFARTASCGFGRTEAAFRYALNIPFPEQPDRVHLGETLGWLQRAQDVGADDGVSALFDLRKGWDVSYPETSGYILATFIAAADALDDSNYLERARRIGDWEIAIQAPNGGVYSRPGTNDLRVFNTGQVILGWCALFERTSDERYLDAARRAGDYLLRIQETDGTWRQDTYCGPRTYHARADWGLVRLAKLTADERYANGAKRNLAWVMQQQQVNGWFKNCGFDEAPPITHLIDYTFIGILECAILEPLLFDKSPVECIREGASAICGIVRSTAIENVEGLIPGSFGPKWKSDDRYSCLTGNAQLSYTLFRLHGLTGDLNYKSAAEKLISGVKRTQIVGGKNDGVRGAIAGCFPVYAGYLAGAYPNWAAKFFADALLASMYRKTKFSVAA